MFNAEEYKKKLEKSTDIKKCEKVPAPIVRDNTYIFISYCHKDYKKVYSDLADLYSAGARFRYDAEFLPGLEWDEEQVRKIIESPRCVGTIFYLSEDSLSSESVHKEIKMVSDSDKLSFAINLSDLNPTTLFNIAAGNMTKPLTQSIEKVSNDYKRINEITEKMRKITDSFNLAQNVILGPDAKNPSRIILERPELIDGSSRYLDSLKYGIQERFNVMPDKEVYILFEGSYKGDLKNNMRHGHGILKTNLNECYDGEWVDDKPNGHGIFTYAEGGLRKYYDGKWENGKKCGHGKMVFRDGRTYDGEWKNDKYNGHGIYTYNEDSNIKYYDGEWVDDVKSGQGKMVYKDGETYEGEWANNKRNGQGTYTYLNGKQWIGEWKDGKRWNGNSTLCYYSDGKLNGNVYEGELREGKCNGRGIYICNEDSHIKYYDGEWIDDKPNGHGKTVFRDGRTYDGEWKNGKYNGHGIFTYSEDNAFKYYDGEWVDGVRCGHGTLVFKDGRVYEGDWKNDLYNGHGIFTYSESSNLKYYDGEWVDDVKSGQGKMVYKDGETYEGEWADNKRNGQGTYTYLNGKQWTGEWKDDKIWSGNSTLCYYSDGKLNGNVYEGELREGKRNGHGIYTYNEDSNIKYYDGEWVDDVKCGQGKMVYKDDETYEGEWANNKQNGQGTYTYLNGKQWIGEWKDGIKWNGNSTICYYSEGKLNGSIYEGELKEGKYNGHGILINANGSVYEGEWKDGKKNGHGVETSDQGSILDCEWENDNPVGKIHFSMGELIVEGEFEMLNGDGKGTMYYPGDKIYMGEFSCFVPNGKGVFTDKTSGTIYKGTFKNGMLCGNGSITIPKRYCYEGEIENNMPNGYGKIAYGSGSVYEGELKDGNRSGIGKMVFVDGTCYDGEWKANRITGKGILTKPNGKIIKNSTRIKLHLWLRGAIQAGKLGYEMKAIEIEEKMGYKGEISKGKRNGKGTLTNKNGTYVGEWKDGKRNGHGVFTTKDGSSYDGEWENDKFNGHGVLSITTGDISMTYDGEWAKGKKSGYGVLNCNGLKYVGEWKSGKKNGKGIITYPNSSTYEGEWKDDVPNGYGKYIFADGAVYEGEMKNGNFNGHGVLTKSDGTIESGIWKNNKLVKPDKNNGAKS